MWFNFSRPAIILGIETSCDDTGSAVVDSNGRILGESLHTQLQFHNRLVELHIKIIRLFYFFPQVFCVRKSVY